MRGVSPGERDGRAGGMAGRAPGQGQREPRAAAGPGGCGRPALPWAKCPWRWWPLLALWPPLPCLAWIRFLQVTRPILAGDEDPAWAGEPWSASTSCQGMEPHLLPGGDGAGHGSGQLWDRVNAFGAHGREGHLSAPGSGACLGSSIRVRPKGWRLGKSLAPCDGALGSAED